MMGNSRLPANNLWSDYKINCEKVFHEVTSNFYEKLTNIAKESAFYLDDSVKNNIWLRRLDWTHIDLTTRKDAQSLIVSSLTLWMMVVVGLSVMCSYYEVCLFWMTYQITSSLTS